MKTQQISKGKATSASNEALLKLQLSEAMRLIGELQRSNAELMRQNASLMQINSTVLLGNNGKLHFKRNNLQVNEDDRFINDVLSLITDNSVRVIDNNLSVINSFPFVIDGNLSDSDNNTSVIDNNTKIIDDNLPVPDKKTSVNDKSRKKKDNKLSVTGNTKSLADNNASQIDNSNDEIECNGKMINKKILLERLHYRYNLTHNRNFNEEELIKIWRDEINHVKELNKRIIENRMRKVPALFFLNKQNLKEEHCYKEAFHKIYYAYKNLKQRNRKNLPSLKRQANMLIHLYEKIGCKPDELFAACGVTAVSGFRYVAKLTDFGFMTSSGRGTGCHYSITPEGEKFLEEASSANFVFTG
ncbi:MAG TPA: hypothetical protein VJY62_11425 [Bacteroidia bacterium]|nr:hypothetical protein [Bacteroidia bacterium]